jgi:hypothetical protein
MVILRGLDVVFDCAVNGLRLTALAAEVRFSLPIIYGEGVFSVAPS